MNGPSMDLTIVEVGPRDGLQNEAQHLSLDAKVELVQRLVATGVRRIEVGSFVHPKAVPQMADTDALCARLERRPGLVYTALILNERGLDRAIDAGVDQVTMAFAATDTFNQRNQHASAQQSMEEFKTITRRAQAAGLRCALTIGAAFGCPFEGVVPPARVVDFAAQAAAAGVDELLLADTIGVAVPTQVTQLLKHVRAAVGDGVPLGVHLHNTRNTGYANAYAAFEAGAMLIDAAVGGTGGCPFAPRATGNIATEDVVYLFEQMGVATGIDLDAMITTAHWVETQLGTPLPGQLMKSGPFPHPATQT